VTDWYYRERWDCKLGVWKCTSSSLTVAGNVRNQQLATQRCRYEAV